VTTLARAIQRADSQHAGHGNPNLVYLRLEMPDEDNRISDAAGIDLAEALTVNQTLGDFSLTGCRFGDGTYTAFGNMLRVRTEFVLDLPRLASNEAGTVANAYTGMVIGKD
jgi:hypothetical protein